jgi:lysophospholipase L1-like esterase
VSDEERGVKVSPGHGAIALVGDSHLTDTSTRKVWKLGPRLRAAGWDVTTCAVGGLTTRAALDAPPPPGVYDWAVYCFGTNDAAPWKAVPLPEFSDNFHRLIGRTQAKPVVLGPPPVSETSESNGRTRRLIEQYSAAAEVVARGAGASFISLIDMLGEADLAEGGVHLNDDGYDKIHAAVAVVLGSTR